VAIAEPKEKPPNRFAMLDRPYEEWAEDDPQVN